MVAFFRATFINSAPLERPPSQLTERCNFVPLDGSTREEGKWRIVHLNHQSKAHCLLCYVRRESSPDMAGA